MDPDWTATQTIAPSGVTATARDGGTIRVSWTAIPYAGHTGYYAVYRSETPGGPYTLAGQTANKTLTSFDVSGLTVGQRYYFVVLTHTDAHSNDQNPEDSGYSLEATAIARTLANVTVGGTILLGITPVPNVEMSGFPTAVQTNALGVYLGTVEAGWTGTITPLLTGHTFDPISRDYSSGVTENLVAQDYAATLDTYTITGTILFEGAGLPGVTISGLPGPPVTDGAGTYTATVNHGTSWTATPILTGHTFEPPTRDHSNITSNQSGQNFTAALSLHTLTVNAANGSVSKSPNLETYGYGSSVQLTPIPAENYHFVSWSGDASGSANPLSVVMDGDKTITANFALVTHTISGTISLSGGGGLEGVTLSAFPAIPRPTPWGSIRPRSTTASPRLSRLRKQATHSRQRPGTIQMSLRTRQSKTAPPPRSAMLWPSVPPTARWRNRLTSPPIAMGHLST